MYLKEMVPIVLGLILISSIFGMVYLVQIASQRDAIKLYQKTSLPAIWKKINEVDIDFKLNQTLEYTLYEIISEGGMMKPSEFIEKINEEFSKYLKSYPHTYNYDFSLDVTPQYFASGDTSEIKVTLEVKLKGDEIESVKVVEKTGFSNIRALYLYEKAYMFYRYALEGKPIHCFSWDGDKKITVTVYSFGGDTATVQLKWNLTQASFESGSGGAYEKFEDELYEVFECVLSNGKSCWVKLKLNSNKAVIYRWQSGIGELVPVLVEKHKPYSMCIATRENVAEEIKEKVENECKDTDCLPRKVEGQTSCNYCPDTEPSGGWALGRELDCLKGCSLDTGCLDRKLKDNLREFIQNIVDDVANRETNSEVEWDITVNIDELSYSSTPGENCPECWLKVCEEECDCRCNECPEEEEDEDYDYDEYDYEDYDYDYSSSKKIYTYTLFPFTRYYEKPLIWEFSYTDSGDASGESVGRCEEKNDEQCRPCINPCAECACGGVAIIICDKKEVCKYKYSYSYDYTYTLTITIKDKKKNIILAG